jgi:predicted HicB family RNase H-like nuclease
LKLGLPLQEVSRRLHERLAVEAERADGSGLTLVDELLQHRLGQCLNV